MHEKLGPRPSIIAKQNVGHEAHRPVQMQGIPTSMVSLQLPSTVTLFLPGPREGGIPSQEAEDLGIFGGDP